MELNADTKIDTLLKEYPFLLDFLSSRWEPFNKLKYPIFMNTVGKMATLSHAASIGGIEISELMNEIAGQINDRTGTLPQISLPSALSNQENPSKSKLETLKSIIQELHQSGNFNNAKERFNKLVKDVSSSEIAQMEQQLIEEGMPEKEVKSLCDVHVQVFKSALEKKKKPDVPFGHPINTFMQENRACESLMDAMDALIDKTGHPVDEDRFLDILPKIKDMGIKLHNIDIHFLRKENQLFPLLEKHGIEGPSKVMWDIHDDIRKQIKEININGLSQKPVYLIILIKDTLQKIRDMIYKEEHILFPLSLDTLSNQEWKEVKDGESDIGYAWIKPGPGYTSSDINNGHKDAANDNMLSLSVGKLSLEQINLMFNHLPVEASFVDEQDTVRYYTEGTSGRIFPRSPAVIGRNVQNCHPPKSVDTVNKILSEFKKGTRNSADFWINFNERIIYIRYFAVRDSEGNYKGTLEVTQDITDLQKLKGERRLLDWK